MLVQQAQMRPWRLLLAWVLILSKELPTLPQCEEPSSGCEDAPQCEQELH